MLATAAPQTPISGSAAQIENVATLRPGHSASPTVVKSSARLATEIDNDMANRHEAEARIIGYGSEDSAKSFQGTMAV